MLLFVPVNQKINIFVAETLNCRTYLKGNSINSPYKIITIFTFRKYELIEIKPRSVATEQLQTFSSCPSNFFSIFTAPVTFPCNILSLKYLDAVTGTFVLSLN